MDVALHVLDYMGIAVDPAVEAHALPIGRWATAIWERWAPLRDMEGAFERMRAAAQATDGIPEWRSVAGPVAAFAASLARIGWTAEDAMRLRDDLGTCWHLLQESPAAVRAAVLRSVRRWRLGRICSQLPALTEGAAVTHSSVAVDVSRSVSSLLTGAARSVDAVPRWERRCGSSLASAMADAQWPQARRAAVRTWGADSRCQLCLAAAGTLEHRRCCPVTVPEGGWTRHGPDTAAFVARLAPARARIIRTRALFVEWVPRPPAVDAPAVRWITEPPDATRLDQRWFTDGSLVDAKWDALAVAAAALVVVSDGGELLAVAGVRLPPAVRTAPAAEASAIALATAFSVSPPRIVTDCKSLLTAARAGAARATAASSPLAGIWNAIVASCNGDLTTLADEQLIWMPAHTTARGFAGRCKSDGTPVTPLEWRANRLADAVAKQTARHSAVPRTFIRALDVASRAVRIEAAALGAVTHAANHVATTTTTASGATVTRVRRDAVTIPATAPGAAVRPWRRRATPPPVQPRPLAMTAAGAGVAERDLDPSWARAPTSAAALARRENRRADAAFSSWCVSDILAERAASSSPAPGDSHARFAALRERIRAREAAVVAAAG